MTGLPFLDQLTAITQKYVGTCSNSSRLLMSLWARSMFFLSVSCMGGLNCSMSQCQFASSLGVVSIVSCFALDMVFWVGLITVGLSDLTHCGVCIVLDWGIVCQAVGCSGFSTFSCWYDNAFPVWEKLTTASERFLMVMGHVQFHAGLG